MITKTTALELGKQLKKAIVEQTGLNPDYIYVLSEEPNEKGMTLGTHGWSGEVDGVVEVVAEEAGDYLNEITTQMCEAGSALAGNFDFATGFCVVIYGDLS